MNTKVALRVADHDYAKWHAASGLVGAGGAAFGASDLDPHYDRVETRLGVRERADWKKSVHTVEPGFRALGAHLEPVRSYTDANCMSCGSCLQGCPTNAGQVDAQHLHPRRLGDGPARAPRAGRTSSGS